MNSTVIHTRLGAIEYCSTGQGIPVIFVHGGHSNCYETLCHKGFDSSIFQLIVPSRPGYGKTPLKGNETPEKAADLMAELMSSLGIEKAIVYGISAGGLTALELAANYSGKVEKLVLASAVSKKWLNKDDRIYKTARIIFHPNTERLTWGLVRFFSKIFPGLTAKSFYPQFSSYPTHKLEQEPIRELLAAFKKYRSKRGFLNDLDQDIHPETLKKIECPTLVIHSRFDNSVSMEHANHSRETIKNSKLIELQNKWGHLFWIGKDAEQSIKKTVEFIHPSWPAQNNPPEQG